jgi:hypothetical protein
MHVYTQLTRHGIQRSINLQFSRQIHEAYTFDDDDATFFVPTPCQQPLTDVTSFTSPSSPILLNITIHADKTHGNCFAAQIQCLQIHQIHQTLHANSTHPLQPPRCRFKPPINWYHVFAPCLCGCAG